MGCVFVGKIEVVEEGKGRKCEVGENCDGVKSTTREHSINL